MPLPESNIELVGLRSVHVGSLNPWSGKSYFLHRPNGCSYFLRETNLPNFSLSEEFRNSHGGAGTGTSCLCNSNFNLTL